MQSKTKLFVIIGYLILLFIIPSFTIFKTHNILNKGTVYRFKTRPVDPFDPFRGAYVTLNYDQESFTIPYDSLVDEAEEVYCVFKKNDEGYDEIDELLLEVPTDRGYLKVKVSNAWNGYKSKDSLHVRLSFPFDRYYLDQEDAKLAEKSRWHLERQEKVYVDVKVLDGEAVLEELYFDDLPVKKYLVKYKLNQKEMEQRKEELKEKVSEAAVEPVPEEDTLFLGETVDD